MILKNNFDMIDYPDSIKAELYFNDMISETANSKNKQYYDKH